MNDASQCSNTWGETMVICLRRQCLLMALALSCFSCGKNGNEPGAKEANQERGQAPLQSKSTISQPEWIPVSGVSGVQVFRDSVRQLNDTTFSILTSTDVVGLRIATTYCGKMIGEKWVSESSLVTHGHWRGASYTEVEWADGKEPIFDRRLEQTCAIAHLVTGK